MYLVFDFFVVSFQRLSRIHGVSGVVGQCRFLKELLPGNDVDDGHDVRYVDLIVGIDVCLSIGSCTCNLVDDSHDVGDVDVAVFIDISLH